MEQLLSYDRQFFKVINSQWSNAFFDWLMPWLRNAEMWYPLYLFLVLLILFNYRKTGWIWILFVVGAVVFCDIISSHILKIYVHRIRPCNEPSYTSWIHILVGYRPQSNSFTSSHATNHFGMAAFFYFTLKEKFKTWPVIFFVWAFGISFAQVYVGVHYPFDVICGGLIGILIGYLSGKSFNKSFGLV